MAKFLSQQEIRSLGRSRFASATAGLKLSPTRLAKSSTPSNKDRAQLLADSAGWDLASPFPKQWCWRMEEQSLLRAQAGIKARRSRFGLRPLPNQPNMITNGPRTVVDRRPRRSAFRICRVFWWLTIIRTLAPE